MRKKLRLSFGVCMQAVGVLGRSIESGRVIVSTGDRKALEISLMGKRIDVNVENKVFLKKTIKLFRELSGKLPSLGGANVDGEEGKSKGPLGLLKEFADTLDQEGMTLTVSYKGNVVVTLGFEARSRILQIITKTRAVAINSMVDLIGMMV